jgi:hypothetical protein
MEKSFRPTEDATRRTATPATRTPIPPRMKTVAKHRPAPLATRAAHGAAAPAVHCNSKLQCYIRGRIEDSRRSPLATRHKLNRQLSATSRSANRAVCVPVGLAGNAFSNRHSLEVIASPVSGVRWTPRNPRRDGSTTKDGHQRIAGLH